MSTRRSVLAVTGLSVVFAAVHRLMRPGVSSYPQSRRSPNRPGMGQSLTTRALPLIRPPGAVEEKAFLAGCIRCNRCQDACDVGAIALFPQQDGPLAHTPHIQPEVKGCTLCLKCTHVCPTGVLQPLKEKDKLHVKMADLSFHKDLCLSFKAKRIRDEQALLMESGREATEADAPYERRGPCGECYMFCPLRNNAVNLEPGYFLAPKFDETQCAGCGMCEEICQVVTQGRPAIRLLSRRNQS